MNTPQSESMLLDFDGWLGQQDEDVKAALAIDELPEAERPAEKQRIASMFAVAEATGIDAMSVDMDWDEMRGGYAEQQGEEWYAVKDDEGAFYTKLRERAQQRKDERGLLLDKDGLTSKAIEAAYSGKPYSEAFASWQEAAKAKNGYDPARAAYYEQVARENHAKFSETLAKVKPIADQAFRSMLGERVTGEEVAAPVAAFRGMSPEEKQTAFRLMTDWAKGENDKGRAQAFWEAAGRGFENLFVGGGSAQFRNAILSTRFSAGDKVTRKDPVEEVMADMATSSDDTLEFGRNVERMTGRALTAAEAAEWNKRLAEVREDVDTAEELRKFAQGTVDPTKAGGWLFQKVVLPVADSTALMASMAIPGAPAAAFKLRMESYQNEEYMKLRAAGMDAEQANGIAGMTALGQAALDQAQFGILKGLGKKYLPQVSRTFEQFALSGSAAARFGVNFGSTALAETSVEMAQDYIVPAMVQDLATNDPDFDVAWGKVWSDAAEAFPETFLGMVLLSGLGGVAQTRGQAEYVRQLTASKAAMRLQGYSLEQIDTIQAAPEEERGALLAENLPAKAPEGAEKAALIEDVARLEAEEKAAFEAKASAELAATQDAADYAIRVSKQGLVWRVTTASGKEIEVDSADAARRIRDDLTQAETQKEAEALVAIIDSWHSKAKDDTTRETTLTGEEVLGNKGGLTAFHVRTGAEREITDARTLATFHEEARMDAVASGSQEISAVVNGSNVIEFIDSVASAAKQTIQRLELNKSESTALTAIHEQIEATWRTAIAKGTISRGETQDAIRSIASVFAPENARTAEDRAFRERVQRVANGTGSETELRETLSELVTAEVVGRRKDGGVMPAGSVSAALEAAILNSINPEQAKGLTKFRAFLRAAKTWFRAVLGTVAAIKKQRREGGAQEFDALVNKLLGLDEQAAHQQAVADEVEALTKEITLSGNLRGELENAREHPKAYASLEQAFIDARDVIATITRLGAKVVVLATPEDFAPRFGMEIGPVRGFTATVTAGGETSVFFIASQLERFLNQGHPAVTREALQQSFFHEAVHAAERDFAMRPENRELHQAAMGVIDAESPDFDQALDSFMREEYPSWDKLSLRSKLSETVRAVIEGRVKETVTAVKNGRFTEYLHSFLDYVRGVFRHAISSTADFRSYVEGIEKTMGVSPRTDEAEAIAAESELDYVPPSEEDLAAGVAFSVSRPRMSQFADLQKASLERQARLEPAGSEARAYFEEKAKQPWPYPWREMVRSQYESLDEIRALKFADVFDGPSDLAPEAAVLLTDAEESRFIELEDSDRTPEETAELQGLFRKVKAGLIDGWKAEEAANTPEEEVEEEESEEEETFSVSAGSRLELVQRRIESALARDPAKRLEIRKRAIDKLQSLQFQWETERWTPSGDTIRPLVERRGAESLDKEQAFREATRADEIAGERIAKLSTATLAAFDNGLNKLEDSPLIATILGEYGKIVSRSTALRRYSEAQGYDGAPWLPPKWFAGPGEVGVTPDTLAQGLYEDGILREPSPDALWDALRREVESARSANEAFKEASQQIKAIEREARNEAKREAADWRREQQAMQEKDWSPKARLLRDLRTLDALLSVFPAEVRGKVGGFVKLASLGSDKARADEIGRRIKKLSTVFEKHLQEEYTDALLDLLQKASPSRESGKQSRGKLGAEGHAFFDKVAGVLEMTEEAVRKAKDDIAAAYFETDSTGAKVERALSNTELADLFEREQILDTFGNWNKKPAADMDAALRMAQTVYDEGRNKWRMLEEERLNAVGAMADQIIETLGGSGYAASQRQKAAAKGIKKKIANAALDLKSFAEVLEALLGRGHPLAEKWTRAAREGFARRNDDIRALRKRWKDAIENATRRKGVEARRILWDMGQVQTVSVDKPGAASGGSVSVPIAIIDSWIEEKADASALGYTPEEAVKLIAMRQEMEAGDQRKNLPLNRSTRAAGERVKMTQAEAIFLTMLGAQEQYADALDRAGWTSDVLEAIEGQLTEAAKKLRMFMRTEYAEGYAPLAAIFERMYGVALPQIRNYAPAAFYHQGAERETGPEDNGGLGQGMRAGFLRNRKQHTAAPRLENAFATFFGHATQTAHWRGLAEFVREFSGVLGRPDVKQAIEGAYGSHMLKTLNDWMRNLEGNGLQQQAGMLDKAVSWLTSAQASIALAYRLGTLAKQSTALLGSAYRIPVAAYVRGFGKLVSGQLDTAKVFQSPAIKRRLESGFAPEVRAALNDIWTSKPSRRAAILERGMELIGLTDALFTTGSAAIAYDYHLQQAQAAGMEGVAAERAAMREVEDLIGRTAQPADVVDRSLFEARLNPFGRLLFMFASEARQKSSLWLTAWQNTLTGKATGDDYRVLALAHLVVAPMLQTITAAWRDMRDDDDEEIFDADNWNPLDFLKAIVAGPLSGIPLVGEALSGFPDNGIFGRQVFAVKSLKQLFSGPKEREPEKVEWYMDRIFRIMQGLDSFTGVAGSVGDQVFSIADNFLPDSEEEVAKKERAARARERKERQNDD